MVRITIAQFLSSKFFYLLGVISAFFADIQMLLIMIICLCFVDLITAIIRTFRESEEKGALSKVKAVKSRKLRRTFIKMFLYLMFIMCCYLLPVACFGTDLYMAEIAGATLGIVELKSIAENMSFITGNDGFTRAFKKIRKIIEEHISGKMENPE